MTTYFYLKINLLLQFILCGIFIYSCFEFYYHILYIIQTQVVHSLFITFFLYEI